MKNLNDLDAGKFGEIKVSINLIVPAEILHSSDKEKIADYLNEKLYQDPEFFGDFGKENIQIISHDISTEDAKV